MPAIYKNGNIYGGMINGGNVWEGTQAQYDAITTKDPATVYYITDSTTPLVSAAEVTYSNTSSGLSATAVQGAIDEVVEDKADRVPEPAEYDPTVTYAPGDFCTHDGAIYRATTNATGTWDSGKWRLCTPQQDYLHSINPNGNGSFSLNRKMGTTIGTFSFAAGNEVTATGTGSHAEGYGTTASGSYSHAEGHRTTASGVYGSHSEGYVTTASGSYSHSEGNYTTANHRSQHVFGEYNIEDPSTAAASSRGNYVEIVGNGTADNTRSNARTLDWSGNEVLAGGLKINGTEDVATNAAELPITSGSATNTKTYIDKIAPHLYRVVGTILDSDGGTIKGAGTAMITLSNGIARIDFALDIEVADTVSHTAWGINRDLFTSTVGKTITPTFGGVLTYYKPDGTIDTDRHGYGGAFGLGAINYWKPARIYRISANPSTYGTGTWADNLFPVGSRMVGTCWGTYT